MLRLANNATALLGAAINASSTTITLAAGAGSKFPTLAPGEWFPLTLVNAKDVGHFEIVRVTARSGDILTVVRAQEGTAAKEFSAGDLVDLRLTAAALNQSYPQVKDGKAAELQFDIFNDGGTSRLAYHGPNSSEITLTLSDVATGRMDTTDGKLLKVGDGGINSTEALADILTHFDDKTGTSILGAVRMDGVNPPGVEGHGDRSKYLVMNNSGYMSYAVVTDKGLFHAWEYRPSEVPTFTRVWDGENLKFSLSEDEDGFVLTIETS